MESSVSVNDECFFELEIRGNPLFQAREFSFVGAAIVVGGLARAI